VTARRQNERIAADDLKGAGALPLLAGQFSLSALAQTAAVPPTPAEIPPILFVHGNGDHAALWITTLWRMESNGVRRERMSAINFTDRSPAPTISWRNPIAPRPRSASRTG